MGRRTGVGQNVGERAHIQGFVGDGEPLGLGPGKPTSQGPPGGGRRDAAGCPALCGTLPNLLL